jgi:hypothetical protein
LVIQGITVTNWIRLSLFGTAALVMVWRVVPLVLMKPPDSMLLPDLVQLSRKVYPQIVQKIYWYFKVPEEIFIYCNYKF